MLGGGGGLGGWQLSLSCASRWFTIISQGRIQDFGKRGGGGG